ncbi:MAG: hypothetical protein IJS88_03080 [Alphaproteobacteria bacterium]|nr:hypothetical protein [Alphaproteobacteria bacterium]
MYFNKWLKAVNTVDVVGIRLQNNPKFLKEGKIVDIAAAVRGYTSSC